MQLTSLVLLAIASVTTVVADHRITVYNYCGSAKRAHVKSGAFNYISGNLNTNGGTYAVTVPERGKLLHPLFS